MKQIRYRFPACFGLAGIVSVSLCVPPSGETKADSARYAVVVRLDAKSAGLTVGQLTLRIGDVRVPVTTIRSSSDLPKSIAIVIDAGPDQRNVLFSEKELAIALMNEFSGDGTTFTIAAAGTFSEPQATADRSVAIERVLNIAGTGGVQTSVPIYDPIGSAIRQISVNPGLRIVVFIGEGNDGGSKVSYPELRSLAQANQVAFLAELVADHSLRGAKSTLRYGWNLRELASDTAGIFLEKEKTSNATRRLSESIRGLSLIGFELPPLRPGRYKVSVSGQQGKRLRVQKAIVIP